MRSGFAGDLQQKYRSEAVWEQYRNYLTYLVKSMLSNYAVSVILSRSYAAGQ